MSAEQNSSQPRHEKASDELIDAMQTLGSPVFTPYAALWPSSTRRSQSNTLDLGLAEQAADAYMFHAAVQCALNIEPSGQEMCPRTVQRYEKLFVEEETACLVMTEVTGRLREELDLEVKQQRLDSTHVFSDMATFARTRLMGVTIKRFLTQIRRHDAAAYEALPSALREALRAGAEPPFWGRKNERGAGLPRDPDEVCGLEHPARRVFGDAAQEGVRHDGPCASRAQSSCSATSPVPSSRSFRRFAAPPRPEPPTDRFWPRMPPALSPEGSVAGVKRRLSVRTFERLAGAAPGLVDHGAEQHVEFVDREVGEEAVEVEFGDGQFVAWDVDGETAFLGGAALAQVAECAEHLETALDLFADVVGGASAPRVSEKPPGLVAGRDAPPTGSPCGVPRAEAQNLQSRVGPVVVG